MITNNDQQVETSRATNIPEIESISRVSNQRNGKSNKTDMSKRRWVVLCASVVLAFNSTGQLLCIGALFPEMMDVLQSTRAEAALVQSVGLGVFAMFGTVAGLIIHWIGTRKSGILGGLLMGTGYMASYFATDIYFLVVSIGIISGIGTSFQMVTAMTSAGSYFQGSSQILAVSTVSMGAGLGAIVTPYILVSLEAEYGLRGTFLVVGGLILNTVAASFTLVPNKSIIRTAMVSKTFHDTEVSSKQQNNKRVFRQNIVNILKNEQYLLGPVCMAFATGVFAPSMFLVVDVIISRGYDKNSGVIGLFLMNVMGFFGRLLPGVFKQCPHMSVFSAAILAYFCSGIAMLMLPVVSTYPLILLMTSIIGFSAGVSMTSSYSTTAKIVTKDMFSTAVGMTQLLQGVAMLALPPIAGYMKDKTGTYDSTFIVNGSVLLLCSLLVCIAYTIRICRSRRARKRKEKQLAMNETDNIRNSVEATVYFQSSHL